MKILKEMKDVIIASSILLAIVIGLLIYTNFFLEI
jgi:hypothetical protein